MRYHAASSSPTITFNVFGTPVHQHASFGDYLFYYADNEKEGEAAELYPTDFELADIPLPVRPENGFATVSSHPGGNSIRRELSLPAQSYSLVVGFKYRLRLPSGIISWWEYGPMKACPPSRRKPGPVDLKVRPTQVRHNDAHQVINIPESNSLDVMIVE
ncbi:MAG: hypothetical protein Q9184_003987 [Pyrenodesmia sp. 2 TL-2023]